MSSTTAMTSNGRPSFISTSPPTSPVSRNVLFNLIVAPPLAANPKTNKTLAGTDIAFLSDKENMSMEKIKS
jgi:hypothetical protein